ncbi:hypothetical protein J6590_008517 [Homalodisca vitripennis]|nr:hypothetical protein J6590_008517 [Homalodisca vitripennis]
MKYRGIASHHRGYPRSYTSIQAIQPGSRVGRANMDPGITNRPTELRIRPTFRTQLEMAPRRGPSICFVATQKNLCSSEDGLNWTERIVFKEIIEVVNSGRHPPLTLW